MAAEVKAYSGKGKYIFASYSHKDSKKVLNFIAALQEKYNVWFDEGIKDGEEWHNYISSKVISSSIFIFFVSNNSIDDECFCKRELFVADEQRMKPLFIIIEKLDEKKIPPWYRLYSGFQHALLYTFDDPIKYLRQIDNETSADFTVVKKTDELPSKCTCVICGKTFKNQTALDSHIKDVHQGKEEKDFICPKCGEKFKTEQELNQHTKTHYVCPTCGKKCKSEEELKQHIAESHHFVCPKCGQEFMTAKELTEHRKTHMFSCPDCSLKFETKEELKKHIETTHQFICPKCGQKFKTRKLLTKHEKTHMVLCPTCGKKCKDQEELKQHIIAAHQFICPKCGQKFKTELELRKHCRTHYVCPTCGKKCETEEELKKHINNAHPSNPFNPTDITRIKIIPVIKPDKGRITSLGKKYITFLLTVTASNCPDSIDFKSLKVTIRVGNNKDCIIKTVSMHLNETKAFRFKTNSLNVQVKAVASFIVGRRLLGLVPEIREVTGSTSAQLVP